MIKVTYDKEVDAKYVSIRSGKVHETKTINEWLFVDVDSEGSVLGIEILDSSKNNVNITTLDNELSELLINDGVVNSKSFVDMLMDKRQFAISSEVVMA
jgi:uncharacterized protein YuzE